MPVPSGVRFKRLLAHAVLWKRTVDSSMSTTVTTSSACCECREARCAVSSSQGVGDYGSKACGARTDMPPAWRQRLASCGAPAAPPCEPRASSFEGKLEQVP